MIKPLILNQKGVGAIRGAQAKKTRLKTKEKSMGDIDDRCLYNMFFVFCYDDSLYCLEKLE